MEKTEANDILKQAMDIIDDVLNNPMNAFSLTFKLITAKGLINFYLTQKKLDNVPEVVYDKNFDKSLLNKDD